MLNHPGRAAQKGSKEIAAGNGENQNPKPVHNKKGCKNNMQQELKPGPEYHFTPPGIVFFEKRFPEENIRNIPSGDKNRVTTHYHYKFFPVEGKPGKKVHKSERCRGKNYFHITAFERRHLVMPSVTFPEVNRIIPSEQTEKPIEKLVNPTGFKWCFMTQFMNRRFHAQKTGKHGVEVTGNKHGDPHFAKKKIETEGCSRQVKS